MELLNKIRATVISRNETLYQLRNQVDGTCFVIPIRSMHYVEFPPSMLEGGFLRLGQVVDLVTKSVDGGTKLLYYPDHAMYPVKRQQNAQQSRYTTIKETNAKGSVVDQSVLQALLNEFLNRNAELTDENRAEVTAALAKGNTEQSCAVLRRVLGKQLFPDEGQTCEYKSSFLHPAGFPQGINEADQRNYQMRLLVRELVAFGNARVGGTLLVGVTDAGEVCGIENEISEYAFGYTLEKFQAMFLNKVKQLVNATFMCSLDITWERYEEHLVCRIEVPAWNGDELLFSGEQIFVRSGSATYHLKGQDLLNFIRNTPSVAEHHDSTVVLPPDEDVNYEPEDEHIPASEEDCEPTEGVENSEEPTVEK